MTPAEAREQLAAAVGRHLRIHTEACQAGEARDQLIRAVRGEDALTAEEVAELCGLTPARVRQLAPKRGRVKPVKVASGSVQVSGVVEAAESLCGLLRAGQLVGAQATKRHAPRYNLRVTAWVDVRAGIGVTSNGQAFVVPLVSGSAFVLVRDLLRALPQDVARVFLVGPRPGTTAADVRAWVLAKEAGLPIGWAVSKRGHYLEDADLPVGRWAHADGGEVELHRAASWFGDDEQLTPDDAREAMALVRHHGTVAFGQDASWLSTPATTGRDWWQRSIPAGKEWPVLSPNLRELIATTSGQGRLELYPAQMAHGTTGTPPAMPGVTYLDGRFMYAALCWGMPSSHTVDWHTGEQWARMTEGEQRKLTIGRGRWLVRFTVPKDWRHVGILPVAGSGGTWTWPAEPGARFTTWADGVEVTCAIDHGWHVEVLEGVSFAEGKPLNTWADRLVAAWSELSMPLRYGTDADRRQRALAAGAIRRVLLFGLGAFATRSHMSTIVVPLDQAEQLPSNARVTQDGDQLVAQVPTGNSWAESMAHPEWPATVWARARVRLLDGPGAAGERVGALHVPPASLVAMRTDALYLTADPGWADDGTVGRFRVKGHLDGPLPWPAGWDELFAIRDKAEASA